MVSCLEGRIEVRCDRHSTTVASGDTLILDLNQAVSLEAAAFSAIAVMVPRAKAPAVLHDAPFHGAVLKAGRPSGVLMARSTSALLKAVAGATLDQSEALVLATLDFAADLFATEDVSHGGASAGAVVASHLRPNLGRDDLSERVVAQLGGLSVSELQQLFGGRGGLRDAVAALRVEAARRYRLIDRDIAERALARLVGYPSRSVFASDVRRRFGSKRMVEPFADRASVRGETDVSGEADARP